MKRYVLLILLNFPILLLSQSTWTGAINTEWFESGNWSGGIVPSGSSDAVIPDNCNFYPVIDNPVSIKNININDGASLSVNENGIFYVSQDCNVGEGAGGELLLNEGQITVGIYMNTKSNSSVILNGGLLVLQEWAEDYENELYYGKGFIHFNGCEINAYSIYFSQEASGVLEDGTSIHVTGNYYTGAEWVINGGTLFLYHSSWKTKTGQAGLCPSPDGNGALNAVLCNVVIDCDEPDEWYGVPFESDTITVKGNFTILNGIFKSYDWPSYADNAQAMVIEGDLNINNNTELDLEVYEGEVTDLYIQGNWINNGDFIASTSDIYFIGNNQIIEGDNHFYNFEKQVGTEDILYFQNGSEQLFENGLVLKGQEGNLLSLRSTEDGEYWYLSIDNLYDISYVDVKDSYNQTLPVITPPYSINSGNNVNWFDSSFIITFIVYGESNNPVQDAEITIDGQTLITNDVGEAQTNLEAGVYDYSVTAEGYAQYTDQITVNSDMTVEVNLLLSNIDFIKKPIGIRYDPASNIILLDQHHWSGFTYTIYSISGHCISNGNVSNNDKIHISDYSPGFHILKLTNDQEIKTFKFISK